MVEVVTGPLILNKKGEAFLIRSPKWGDAYLFPGGHIEEGETIFDSVIREAEEETGLKILPKYIVNAGERIFDPEFHRKAHLIYFHLVCEALTEEVKADTREVSEYIWIDPKKALELKLLIGTRKAIENYLKGVRLDITTS